MYADFVRRHLQSELASHCTLLERIPSIPDLQCAWLILLFCASTRANFLLRALPPSATREFAFQHDTSLRGCLSALLGVEVSMDTWGVASLPLSWRIGSVERTTNPFRSQLGKLERLSQPPSCVLSESTTLDPTWREQLRFVRIWWTQGSLPRLGKSLRGGSARMPFSMMTIRQPRNTGGSSW